ncbi:MAG TPA: hypothetical protein VIV07_04605 [Sphingomicrobium sp.]
MEADFAYFNRRAHEERVAAMKALHPLARQAHIELAKRYDELAGAIAAHERLITRDLVGVL